MLNRRDALKGLGLIGLASFTPSLFAAQRKKSLGIALVGLGYYSRDLLAPALQLTSHCHLAGLVTGSPEKIPSWQKQYAIADKNIYNYDNMHQLANNPDIDVVYIVTPTGLHKKFALIAANAGKHVWCEKPMAMSSADCAEIIAACNKNMVKLSIGYRMQHEPNTQRIMAMAKSKPYGAIQTITAEAGYQANDTSYHWRLDPKLGGGALFDMGVYPLNAARYAAGEEPFAVSAHQQTHNPLYAQVGESTWFELQFPSGAKAKCLTSYSMNLNQLHVDCAKGWYELKPFQAYTDVQGKTSDGLLLPPDPHNQQARQMDNDALAILNNTQVLVPGEEGMRDIKIIEGILAAIKTQSPVKLPFSV